MAAPGCPNPTETRPNYPNLQPVTSGPPHPQRRMVDTKRSPHRARRGLLYTQKVGGSIPSPPIRRSKLPVAADVTPGAASERPPQPNRLGDASEHVNARNALRASQVVCPNPSAATSRTACAAAPRGQVKGAAWLLRKGGPGSRPGAPALPADMALACTSAERCISWESPRTIVPTTRSCSSGVGGSGRSSASMALSPGQDVEGFPRPPAVAAMRHKGEEMRTSVSSGDRRRGSAAVAMVVVAAALFALMSAPAQAARQITPPQWFACGTYYPGMISIGPPRIWSSYNRPEQVVWIIQIQRWDGTRWSSYGRPYSVWSTFNYYGQSVTSWASFNSSTGGRFVNSGLHLRVGHVGYYRLAVAINGNQGGATWTGFVQGGAHCYMN